MKSEVSSPFSSRANVMAPRSSPVPRTKTRAASRVAMAAERIGPSNPSVSMSSERTESSGRTSAALIDGFSKWSTPSRVLATPRRRIDRDEALHQEALLRFHVRFEDLAPRGGAEPIALFHEPALRTEVESIDRIALERGERPRGAAIGARVRTSPDEHDGLLPGDVGTHGRLDAPRPEHELHPSVAVVPFAREEEASTVRVCGSAKRDRLASVFVHGVRSALKRSVPSVPPPAAVAASALLLSAALCSHAAPARAEEFTLATLGYQPAWCAPEMDP